MQVGSTDAAGQYPNQQLTIAHRGFWQLRQLQRLSSSAKYHSAHLAIALPDHQTATHHNLVPILLLIKPARPLRSGRCHYIDPGPTFELFWINNCKKRG
jgi:hypothetical protein